MPFVVVSGTGLLAHPGDQEPALNSITQHVKDVNRAYDELSINAPRLTVPGKWWVYQDEEKALCFRPAHRGRAFGIRVLGTITIKEVPACMGPCTMALMPGETCPDCGKVCTDDEVA